MLAAQLDCSPAKGHATATLSQHSMHVDIKGRDHQAVTGLVHMLGVEDFWPPILNRESHCQPSKREVDNGTPCLGWEARNLQPSKREVERCAWSAD